MTPEKFIEESVKQIMAGCKAANTRPSSTIKFDLAIGMDGMIATGTSPATSRLIVSVCPPITVP